MTESFREGDHVEWIGAPDGERLKFPQTGERGWIEQIHPMDDIVEWDEAGIAAGDFTRGAPSTPSSAIALPRPRSDWCRPRVHGRGSCLR
jgi:hypothetical protein